MVEYSKLKINRHTTEKTENCCQKENRNNSENESEKAWRKWSASWIAIDNKTKNEAQKCI